MEEKRENFSVDEIQKLAQSDLGRQLMALLQAGNTADTVRQKARSGNMREAQAALQAFFADPKAQALLKQLQEQSHG